MFDLEVFLAVYDGCASFGAIHLVLNLEVLFVVCQMLIL